MAGDMPEIRQLLAWAIAVHDRPGRPRTLLIDIVIYASIPSWGGDKCRHLPLGRPAPSMG